MQVQCPSDYRSWQQTMYILFGTKWAKIFTGPMWSHVPIMQAEGTNVDGLNTNSMNPVNVGPINPLHVACMNMHYYFVYTCRLWSIFQDCLSVQPAEILLAVILALVLKYRC